MRLVLKSTLLGFFIVLTMSLSARAKSQKHDDIDPRLVEIVETIKSQLSANSSTKEKTGKTSGFNEPFFLSANELISSLYSRDPETIKIAAEAFKSQASYDKSIDTDFIAAMFINFAEELAENRDWMSIENTALDYLDSDHWFEQFMAYSLSSIIYTNKLEVSHALSHAQKTLSIIPLDESRLSLFARIESANAIAQFSNILGNTDLAIEASLEYLELSSTNFDTETSIDLINNLIFSYRQWRDIESQEYLAGALIELEGHVDSAAPGLSELRIAQIRNDTGDFDEALIYAGRAKDKTQIKPLIFFSEIAEATALIGLGRIEAADKIIARLDVDISDDELLHSTERSDVLYMAYLRARKTNNEDLATALYNRRIDVLSRKNLTDSARDTTSMLAALENTQERQDERAKAAKREAELQAITIQKQRTLNRALIGLLAFLLFAITALLAFLRYRGKTLKILAQKEKEAASADKLKTEFLGVMSHELRTPLNGIIGFADFLSQTHADPDVRKKTGVILDSGQDLLDVVEAMTDMGRIEAGKMEIFEDEVDIVDLITPLIEANEIKATEKEVKFTAFIDPAIHTHMVDGTRLKQCIKTLLDNAVSFTSKGRVHLHITANGEQVSGVDELQIVVADTGAGMSEFVQSRLFTPFMQADTSLKRAHMGTGLSLAIAKALAEMMGGSLNVISREGRGSEFTLKIPVTTPHILPVNEPVIEPQIEDIIDVERVQDEAPLRLTDAEQIDIDQTVVKPGEGDVDPTRNQSGTSHKYCIKPSRAFG